jgi:hypothetical protein
MRYFTLFSIKKWPRYFQKTDEISEVTIFKNQYFPNKRKPPLEVLKEEASDSLLSVYQI